VIVRVITDTREALLIDTGTVYGPPATWNVVPGTVRMTCDGVAVAGPGGVGGVVGRADPVEVGVAVAGEQVADSLNPLGEDDEHLVQ